MGQTYIGDHTSTVSVLAKIAEAMPSTALGCSSDEPRTDIVRIIEVVAKHPSRGDTSVPLHQLNNICVV